MRVSKGVRAGLDLEISNNLTEYVGALNALANILEIGQYLQRFTSGFFPLTSKAFGLAAGRFADKFSVSRLLGAFSRESEARTK